jgi:hypothetical protein
VSGQGTGSICILAFESQADSKPKPTREQVAANEKARIDSAAEALNKLFQMSAADYVADLKKSLHFLFSTERARCTTYFSKGFQTLLTSSVYLVSRFFNSAARYQKYRYLKSRNFGHNRITKACTEYGRIPKMDRLRREPSPGTGLDSVKISSVPGYLVSLYITMRYIYNYNEIHI